MQLAVLPALVAVGFLALRLPTASAQPGAPLPYAAAQVEPDQESSPLGAATDAFKGIHLISPHVRGVRGANGDVYWVDAKQEVLSAYHGTRLLWRANVARAFTPAPAQPRIEKLVLAANVVFVAVDKKGFVEVDRQTGRLGRPTVD